MTATQTSSPQATARAGHHRVGRHRIAYLAHNENLLDAGPTPLVFVHGFSMSVRFWEVAMLPEIAAEHAWYSISLPLHHPSTFEGDAATALLEESAFAKTLGETIRHLVGNRRVRVVGHSVGAFSALAFAVAYPQQCDAVMSVGGFAQGQAEGLAGKLRFFRWSGRFGYQVFAGMWRLQQGSRWFLRKLVRQYAADRAALDAYPFLDETLARVYPDLARHDITAQYTLVHWLLELDVLDDAQQIRCPVWVVAGTEDPVVSYAHQQAYAAALPKGQLFPLLGAGHLSFAERPREFNALLLEFVR